MTTYRTHWTTPAALEELAHAHRVDIEFGTDYAALVIAGVEWRARLERAS